MSQDNGTPRRFGDLKRSMFIREKNFPLLKGKGAEVKHFLIPLSQVFQRHMDREIETHRQIKAILGVAVGMEDILDQYKHSHRFPPDVAEKFRRHTQAFHQLNTALGQ